MLYFAGFLYFTYAVPSVPIRIVMFSVFSLFVHLILLRKLRVYLKSKDKKSSAFQNINIFYILYYIVRVSVLLISGENSTSFFDYNLDALMLLIDGALALIILVAIFTEISNRINEELIDSTKQVNFFADIYRISPVPIMVLSSKQAILYANFSLCEMVKRPEDELIGKDWMSVFLIDEYKAEVRSNIKNISKNDKSYIDTIEILGPGLKKIPVEIDVEGHFDDFGFVSYFLFYMHDLTILNAARNKQIESERSKNSLLANIPGFAYRCKFDKNWTMELLSDSFTEITGYKVNEAINNTLISYNNIIVESFRDEVWNEWCNCINSKKPYMGEYKIKRKTGEEIWVWERGQAIINHNDEVVALEGFVSNINERKNLEEKNIIMETRLRNQQKLEAIGTLAGGIAHEINNPINGIINYGQLLLDSTSLEQDISIYAKEIIYESERIAGIVKNLLQFSSQQDEEFYSAEVCDIVRKSLSLINTILKHDQIVLDMNIPTELPSIICRAHQIQQVIVNLITNSRDSLNEKFKNSNDKKVIKISCNKISYDNKKWIRISVEDNGKGIPKELQTKIFEPFFTTKNRSEGTGLGLAISYGIIREHSGSLAFETIEGEYTKFFVDLPLSQS